jgi:hypothetical protein
MGIPDSSLEKRKVTISKRQKLQREILISELRKNSVMTVACQKAGVPRSTVYRWMKDDSVFLNLVEDVSSEGRDTINDMAESVVIKKVREENLHAAKYWLSHNNERYKPWRNRFSDNTTLREVQLIKEKLKSFFDGVFRKRKK